MCMMQISVSSAFSKHRCEVSHGFATGCRDGNADGDGRADWLAVAVAVGVLVRLAAGVGEAVLVAGAVTARVRSAGVLLASTASAGLTAASVWLTEKPAANADVAAKRHAMDTVATKHAQLTRRCGSAVGAAGGPGAAMACGRGPNGPEYVSSEAVTQQQRWSRWISACWLGGTQVTGGVPQGAGTGIWACSSPPRRWLALHPCRCKHATSAGARAAWRARLCGCCSLNRMAVTAHIAVSYVTAQQVE